MALVGHDDASIRAWVAANEHIVLTHDRTTMPMHAWNRVASGLLIPGVFVVDDFMPIGQVIDEIVVVIECSQPGDWKDIVAYFPLQPPVMPWIPPPANPFDP